MAKTTETGSDDAQDDKMRSTFFVLKEQKKNRIKKQKGKTVNYPF